MRYKILVFGIIFIASILVLMEVDKGIRAKILGVSDYIKTFFLNTGEGIADTYNWHFDQAAQIESLNQKLQDYDKLSLENQNLKNELVKYQKIVGQDGFAHGLSDFHLARIISFATRGEKDRVWLDTNLSNYRKGEALEDRIFGIVKDNAALGVAVVQNGRVEGFLNGNANCNYDVYIGQSRAMGIVSGSSGGNLLVDYIPDWIEIHKGDKVFTSGLDGIFLEIGGPAIIGKNAEVRQCAFIRGNAIVGEGAVVGNSTELKNVILFNKVQVPHYNYVGDSVLGYKAHMGAGS